ncbi:MAG: hypothetical protein HYV35_01875 [Lentisphaerae bacterium]|nr:hypothetical protein [Lentisphaerota bacterium]
MNIPDSKQIRASLVDLFAPARQKERKALWRAIFPVDQDMQIATAPGKRRVNDAPAWEWCEMREFTQQFATIADQFKEDARATARIRMIVYCHIMESDFPQSVIRNLLLLHSGQPEDWTFHGLNKKGQKIVCQQPSQRITEIMRLATPLGLSIGNTLNALWHDTLRHRFSHAFYALTDSFVFSTKNFSPTRRETPMKFAGDPIVTFAELEALYMAALSFVHGFKAEFEMTCEVFRRPIVNP